MLVSGVEHVYPTGNYEIRSFQGSKTKWTRVEGNATEALVDLKRAQRKANALAMADDAGVQVVRDPMRILLRDSYPRFVQAARDRGSKEAAEAYNRSLDEFMSGCSKTYADELTNEDLLKFHAQMRARGLSDRTVSNKHKDVPFVHPPLRPRHQESGGHYTEV